MNKFLYALPLLLFSVTIMSGQTLYDADFSTEGEGFPDHTTSTPPAAGPTSESGGVSTNDWTVSYDDAPSTDASANEFSINSGVLRIQDWGDETATWLSSSIDISASGLINISAVGVTVGNDVQNAGSEFFEYFYILDGGSEVITDIALSGDNDGAAVNYFIADLDVNAFSSIQIGFRFLVNGANDGYEISSVSVTQTALPVEFTKFSAEKRTQNIALEWQTASEINNDRFEIERSSDANRFETIGSVKGNGNSLRLNDYSFVDATPLNGINYYRLKQVDIDGAYEYSDVVSVEMNKASDIRITPTSTLDYITVSTDAPSSIIVRNYNGQVMNRQSNSEGNFSIEMANYPQGIYFLTINVNGNVETKKVIRL